MMSPDGTVLKILRKHPQGIRKDELIKASGLSLYRCGIALRNIRVAGLAGPSMGGSSLSVWATAENLAAIKAEHARAAEAARLQRLQRAEARALASMSRAATAQRMARRAAAAENESDDFARPSVHRLVPAGEWAPVRWAAPFSIFTQTEAA